MSIIAVASCLGKCKHSFSPACQSLKAIKLDQKLWTYATVHVGNNQTVLVPMMIRPHRVWSLICIQISIGNAWLSTRQQLQLTPQSGWHVKYYSCILHLAKLAATRLVQWRSSPSSSFPGNITELIQLARHNADRVLQKLFILYWTKSAFWQLFRFSNMFT